MAKGYLYDNGDELITREDVNEVPDSSSAHSGDVLELDSNKKPKWTTPESGLPSTTSASVGDVLTLDEDKEPVWSAPSGGGGKINILFDQPTVTVGSDTLYPTDKTWQEAVDNCYALDLEGSICFPYQYIEDDSTVTGYPYGYTVRLIPSGSSTLVASSASGTLYFVLSSGD